MKIAVISDIHGNIEAFTSVLADIEHQKVTHIISLGDNIGYGADSESVMQQIMNNNIHSVLGNHELATFHEKASKWFQKDAKIALHIAKKSLTYKSFAFIKRLKPYYVLGDGYFVHGFPPESTRFYLHHKSDAELKKALHEMITPVCFVGHTHQLRLVYEKNHMIFSEKISRGLWQLEKKQKYIINAGSVGQPRDGDPHAKYLIWHIFSNQIEVRAIQYNTITARQKIMRAGIPQKYAECLKPM